MKQKMLATSRYFDDQEVYQNSLGAKLVLLVLKMLVGVRETHGNVTTSRLVLGAKQQMLVTNKTALSA